MKINLNVPLKNNGIAKSPTALRILSRTNLQGSTPLIS